MYIYNDNYEKCGIISWTGPEIPHDKKNRSVGSLVSHLEWPPHPSCELWEGKRAL